MSEAKGTRRRFLADLLFLGGALGAGAFIMRADEVAAVDSPLDCDPTPIANDPTPSEREIPPPSEMHPAGAVAPQRPPTQQAPAIEGRSAAAPPQVKGDVVAPALPEQPKATSSHPIDPPPVQNSPSIRGKVHMPHQDSKG